MEYFDFLAELNKPGMKMITGKYQKAGLQFNLLFKIKKLINSVLRGEIKRLESKKPLPSKKQERMAIGFTKYRIINEQIEVKVHRVLCDWVSLPLGFRFIKILAASATEHLKILWQSADKVFDKTG